MRRIKQISVTNLFGMFNYVIPLHLDDRITIIHGPNGFGKTIILKLLCEIFSRSDLHFFSPHNPTLRTIPFDQICIDFDDGIRFCLTKSFQIYPATAPNNIADEELPICQITFQLFMTAATTLENTIAGLKYTGPYVWMYHPTREEPSFEETWQFGDRMSISPISPILPEPDWLVELRNAVVIHFIVTERLSRTNRRHVHEDAEEEELVLGDTATLYSIELTEAIKTKLAESVALAQSLDRTYPARVVKLGTRSHNMTDDMLRKKLAGLEYKRSQLIATGLLDKDDETNFQVGDHIDEGTKTALSIYVEDTEKKLAIFDEMANKIDLLKRIINKRFLYKEMSISRKKGFLFTTSNGVSLSPTSLSSGEQHELVLFYELLFKVAQGSLILIDEPELSLHVVWQEQFLQDIQEITRLSNIDVLLATHSPDIISDRRDLVVELEGPK